MLGANIKVIQYIEHRKINRYPFKVFTITLFDGHMTYDAHYVKWRVVFSLSFCMKLLNKGMSISYVRSFWPSPHPSSTTWDLKLIYNHYRLFQQIHIQQESVTLILNNFNKYNVGTVSKKWQKPAQWADWSKIELKTWICEGVTPSTGLQHRHLM